MKIHLLRRTLPLLLTVTAALILTAGLVTLDVTANEGSDYSGNSANSDNVVVLVRPGPTENPGARAETTFSLPGEENPYCSSSCVGEVCTCFGTEFCCAFACNECWQIVAPSSD